MSKLSYEVTVTIADIELGTHGSTTACALARAIRRSTDNDTVLVTPTRAAIIHNGEEYLAVLPDEAYEFQHAYDRHQQVVPINFVLEFENKS